jgi:hypothetical protein
MIKNNKHYERHDGKAAAAIYLLRFVTDWQERYNLLETYYRANSAIRWQEYGDLHKRCLDAELRVRQLEFELKFCKRKTKCMKKNK